MQSRRDCKKDPRYDRLLSVLYANIQGYEAKVCHSWLHKNILPEDTQSHDALQR